MQLIRKFLWGISFILISTLLFAQDNKKASISDRQWLRKTELTNTQVNILASYYSQEGNHAVTTGGRGSEELTSLAPVVVVNIPIDSTRQWTFDLGIDIVTSASLDYIDLVVSSDSRKDTRKHFSGTYTKKLAKPRITYSLTGGISNEYDVKSKSLGASISKEFNNGNTELSLKGSAFFDRWIRYEPVELRPIDSGDDQGEDNRNSYNFSLTYSQVVSKRLQFSLSAEVVFQSGLLSSPFHRVFMNDGIDVSGFNSRDLILSTKTRKIENLPDSRNRYPVSLRVNYFLNDLIVIRGYYRYYTDDFDITGHTASLELPVKLSPFITIAPFYRYHTQTASKFFKPFGEHKTDAKFFSSDFDQADLSSNKFGLFLRYAPLEDISIFKTPFTKRSKNSFVHFRSIEFRTAFYDRSDGLNSSIFSFDLGFDLIPAKKK